MKKTAFVVSSVALILLIFSACGSKDAKQLVKQELMLNTEKSTVILYKDTHSGIHGDGHTSIVLQFEDNFVLDRIKTDPAWKKYPLDDTMKALIDSVSTIMDEDFSEEQNLQASRIENGYYTLIDRQEKQEKSILERHSYNYTMAIYDTVNHTLFYFALDT